MFMSRTIFSNLFHKYSTRLHPFVKRPPLPGTRAKLEFHPDTCIMCSLCERKCPSKVISVQPEQGIWEIDLMGCVSCGLCAEVCPTDSITMLEEYREPLLERTTLTYYGKPRKKKSQAVAKDRTGAEKAAPDNAGAGTTGTRPGVPDTSGANTAEVNTTEADTAEADTTRADSPSHAVGPEAVRLEPNETAPAATAPVERPTVPSSPLEPQADATADKTAPQTSAEKTAGLPVITITAKPVPPDAPEGKPAGTPARRSKTGNGKKVGIQVQKNKKSKR